MIIPLDRTTNLKRGNSELFIIDTRQSGNPLIPTAAGDEIPMPELSPLKPVRQIVAYDSTFGLSIITTPATLDPPNSAEMAEWMLTLREQDGTFIIDKMPLSCFDMRLLVNPWQRFFSNLPLPDPRQSYVQGVVEGKAEYIVLEFVYAKDRR